MGLRFWLRPQQRWLAPVSSAVPDAGAAGSALSYNPTFGCTANSINVAQVQLQDDIGTVKVAAEAAYWNGSQFVVAAWSQTVTVDTDMMFGGLLGPTFTFTALPGYYFEVFIWTSVNGGKGTYYPAGALRDAWNGSNWICYTS